MLNQEENKKVISRKEFLKKASIYCLGAVFAIIALPKILGTTVQFRDSDGKTYSPFTPEGGNTSQVLKKKSENDYDYEWGSVTSTDSLHLNGDNSCNYSGSVTRDTNNKIVTFIRTGGLTFTPTRDGNGFISSITDGTKTWTITRNASNRIISWSVA